MIGDLVQVLELPLTPDGRIDIAALNTILRNMQERVFALEGRTQPSQIRNDLQVLGEVNASGPVSASALALGTNTVTPTDPSLSPTIEDAITPQALLWTSSIGAQADLLSPVSPFTWVLKDEFIGGTAGGVGGTDVGDLGWNLFNATAAGASSGFHPGAQDIISGGGAAGIFSTSTAFLADTRYMAAVVKPLIGTQFCFGLRTTFTVADETSLGVYFSVQPATNWRTVTRSSSAVLAQSTSFPFVLDNWVLLEIVLSISLTTPADSYVDFYFNRQRAFRHTGASLSGSVSGFFNFATDDTFEVDRFTAGGSPAFPVWS